MSNASIQIQPVIMAGGSGTRLWPLSRAGYPKQFLVLQGQQSLLQQAALRLAALAEPGLAVAAPMVVGNEEHRFMVLDQLREARCLPGSVLLEPSGRNTAPAVTLAALQAQAGGQNPVLVVTPSDATVTDDSAYTTALRHAVRAAADGRIVILGITPTRPDTGFGYIHAPGASSSGAPVQRFVEKPDASTAQRYLAEGGYYWNGGIFVLRASVWLKALRRWRADIASATEAAYAAAGHDGDHFVRPDKTLWAQVPSESVDYAVMERCPGSDIALHMLPLNAGWNDLGAWDAVWQVASKDAQGNAARGDVMFSADSGNNLVHAEGRLVSVIGLQDVVVVETADAVLVAHRSQSQNVKEVVGRLSQAQRSEHSLHRKVHRPWGWYDSIDNGARHQVKRIAVKPGAALSLQKHHHRAEHWIVVQGTAEVTVGDQVKLLAENESVYIPLGAVHRLRNPGKLPLEIIEVQSGSYLGEDDIVRFEDTYGRA
jgi:mannose-1-phosphate guanylyltransferase / mannose-6-phosphate isomerase